MATKEGLPWDRPCRLRDAVAWTRARVIEAAIQRNGGSFGKAADEMGISRTYMSRLHQRMKPTASRPKEPTGTLRSFKVIRRGRIIGHVEADSLRAAVNRAEGTGIVGGFTVEAATD